ncbi:transposase [Pseudomonas sp.]|uniref:IS66-like element accessory protein TnpA n=1 Tax=Pseudomonas sp. TaxID=306 RepID=UPI00345AC313
MQPPRRSYSKSFKAQVIQECAPPGASIASVALSHGINANLVHKWVRLQSQTSVAKQPAFISLALQTTASRSDSTTATICLKIPHPRGTVKISWPTEKQRLAQLFFEICCDDSHRFHLARH